MEKMKSKCKRKSKWQDSKKWLNFGNRKIQYQINEIIDTKCKIIHKNHKTQHQNIQCKSKIMKQIRT